MQSKAISILAILLTFALYSKAQMNSIELEFGIQNNTDFNLEANTFQLPYNKTSVSSPRIGFNYYKRFSKGLSLKTGLHLSNRPTKTKKTISSIIELAFFYDTLTGQTIFEERYVNNTEVSYSNNFFIEVPLNFKFDLNQNKLRPFFELGFSTSIYWKSKIKTTLEDQTSISWNRLKEHRKLIILTNFALGLSYQVNDNYAINLTSFSQLDIKGVQGREGRTQNILYGLRIGLQKTIGLSTD